MLGWEGTSVASRRGRRNLSGPCTLGTEMKHTRFSRKKNASTAAAAILGLPATKGLGFIGDGWRIRTWFSMRKPYAIAERGFSLNKQTREKGFRPSEILPLRPSSLLLKLESFFLWFDGSLGITTTLRPGCVYRAVVHSNLCIWHVDPVAGCPTYQRKEVERQE